MDKSWLTRRIAQGDVAEAFRVGDDVPGLDRLPFAVRNLLDQMRDGDELWLFCSPPESWAALAGRSGVAVVREGRIISSALTLMN